MRVDGEYGIHEVYFNDAGTLSSYTEDPVSPTGETLEELLEDLERFRAALKEPVLTEADFGGAEN
jgi:hypothetical protein